MKRKSIRVLAVFLATASLLSCVAFAGMGRFTKKNTWPEGGAFRDVSAKSWYQSDVRACYELGLFSGRGGGLFDPTGPVTVAEAVALAARISNIYRGGPGVFDQNCSPWYDTTVKIAISMKVIAKNDFTDADYKRPATRAELAYIFSNALPAEEYAVLNHVASVPDVAADAKYQKSILLLYNAGIVKGSDEYGTFRPDESVKRAEAAAMVRRIAQVSQRLRFVLMPVPTEPQKAEFDEIVSAGDAAYLTVGKNGKYGYMKRDGSGLLCPLAYDHAFAFQDGKGVVVASKQGIDGVINEFGYYDTAGVYHPLGISTTDSWTPGVFWGGYLRFDTEAALGTSSYRLFDPAGKELTFAPPAAGVTRHLMSGVSEGMALVDDEANTSDWRTLSYVDLSGKTVLALPSASALPNGTGKAIINAGSFDRGYAPVLEGTFQKGKLQSALWGIIDKTGAYLFKPQFDNIFFDGQEAEFRIFSETGYASVTLADGVTPAVIHKSGKLLSLTGFDSVGLPADSGTLIAVEKGLLYGYADVTTGKLVIPCKFTSAAPFAGGIATVKVGERYGLIGSDGTFRYDAKYTKIAQGSHDAWLLDASGVWSYIKW